MRSNFISLPSGSASDCLILPSEISLVRMPYVGGQVPMHTLAPAIARCLAIAKPKPWSSETPATNARFPVRSICNMAASLPEVARESRLGVPVAGGPGAGRRARRGANDQPARQRDQREARRHPLQRHRRVAAVADVER